MDEGALDEALRGIQQREEEEMREREEQEQQQKQASKKRATGVRVSWGFLVLLWVK